MEKEIDELLSFLEKIKESGTIVIVEGKKDSAALKNFGIENIIELSKKPIYHVIETIAYKHEECIILTDLDKEGKKLYARLNSELQKYGVRVDNKFREFLFRRTKLRHIEGMPRFVEKNCRHK